MKDNKLTDQEKMSYIVKTDLKITVAVLDGHKAADNDEFSKERKIIEKYRKDLKLIK
jgi:hypothetical protein